MYQIDELHYLQLCENYKNTRHLMSREDQEAMLKKLNTMYRQIAHNNCINAWKDGKLIAACDFFKLCELHNLSADNALETWASRELVEIGKGSYVSFKKLSKAKQNKLVLLGISLTEAIGQ